MRTVEIEDHSATLKALNEHLQIDPKKTAIVTVDMHRGHLDPIRPPCQHLLKKVRGFARTPMTSWSLQGRKVSQSFILLLSSE